MAKCFRVGGLWCMLLASVALAATAAIARAESPGEDEAEVEVGGFGGKWAKTPLGKLISGRIGRAMVLRSELDVTDEQRDKIRAILKSHKGEFAKAMQPIVEQRRKLHDAVMADKTDEKAIRAAGEELGKRIGDAAVQLAPVAQELRAEMTAEQLEKLKAFHEANEGAVDKFFEKMLSE